MAELILKGEVYQVIGAAMDVHYQLGPVSEWRQFFVPFRVIWWIEVFSAVITVH